MAGPQPLSAVGALLGLGDHEHIALVGGGGKTTLLHALGGWLVGSVVLTTTTRMGSDQHGGLPLLVAPTDDEVVAAVEGEGRAMVWSAIDGPKAVGVTPDDCDRWFERVDHVVVEADGARRSPFKAPAPHEPVVPPTVTTMMSVIGADALGRVIADRCHRPLRVAALAGCQPYQRLTGARAAAVLLHERGARRALPPGARLTVVVTKVGPANIEAVTELVTELRRLESSVDVVQLEATT